MHSTICHPMFAISDFFVPPLAMATSSSKSMIPPEKFDALTLMLGRFKDAEDRLKELEATEAEQEALLEKRSSVTAASAANNKKNDSDREELKVKEELQKETAWKKCQTEGLKKDVPEGGGVT